jgi:hypothetical protein
MKGIIFMFGLIGILMMGKNSQSDQSQLLLVTARFQSTAAAQAAGYELGPGLCVADLTFGGLGYRYVNPSLVDAQVDFLQPEAMVYITGSNGTLQLGAVEYIVPVPAWNAYNTRWPQIMGHQFHLNPSLNAYVLHIWVWANNSAGMFEDWNPKVSCP